ncbi:transcriptional repressor [Desulfobacterales bacterium HSG16]|nr:transcriptional repressor [Desulfobacterales bacterium HSG16]
MKENHKQEREQFQKLFKEERIDRFEERLMILEVFLSTERHLTIEELDELLKKQRVEFDIEFVHETLDLMSRFGFARIRQFNNGEIRYEHRHLGQHHDHMICTRCGQIIEFNSEQIEALQIQVANDYGFHILQHKMEIYGICDLCSATRISLIPLAMARPGEQLVIESFKGGSSSRMRLLSMGLRPGDELEVITNSNSGRIVVALDYNRYALGRGLAEKIMVKPLKDIK